MKEIDKTKENIRISDIDNIRRKELFDKFVDAGGKVVTDRDKRRSLAIDREKQSEYQQRLDDHYRSLKSDQRPVSSRKGGASGQGSGSSSSFLTSGLLFASFRIRMRLRFLRVTPLSTVSFHKIFLKRFSEDYKPALIGIQMVYYHFFKKNPVHGRRITGRLDKISTIYFEVIEKIGELYDQMILDQITMHYQNFPDVPKNVSELRDPLMMLFRELYILKSYENIIYNAFEKTLEVDSKLGDGGEQRYKRKDVKNSLYVIFYKLYPRLHALFCYYQGDIFFDTDARIDDILSIAESEKPGSRMKKLYPGKDKSMGNSPDDEDSEVSVKTAEKEDRVDKYTRDGLSMMQSLNLTALKRYDKKGVFEFVDDNDKILVSFLLFLEFEFEYSFVMTTNKIRYNVDFTDNVKVDFKQKMQDIFNETRKCHESFQAYADAYAAYNKIKVQRPLSSDQYYAYSKRLDDSVKRKDQIGSMARMVLRSYMEKLGSELEILISDMDGRQRFIENPQDILDFTVEIEGEKKLHNKKLYEALTAIYSYISALVYRLGPDGDLSGKIDNYDDSKSIAAAETENEVKPLKRGGDSILDELDDIL